MFVLCVKLLSHIMLLWFHTFVHASWCACVRLCAHTCLSASFTDFAGSLGLSTQDQRDAASDKMVMGANPEEAMASAKGNDLEIVIDGAGPETVNIKPQGQAFKDNAMTSIMNTLQNKNITPIVEGVELPDMSKYAGIFNQTNASDYKTMMENAAMGQLAENLGLSTKGYDTSNYFDRMFGK